MVLPNLRKPDLGHYQFSVTYSVCWWSPIQTHSQTMRQKACTTYSKKLPVALYLLLRGIVLIFLKYCMIGCYSKTYNMNMQLIHNCVLCKFSPIIFIRLLKTPCLKRIYYFFINWKTSFCFFVKWLKQH